MKTCIRIALPLAAAASLLAIAACGDVDRTTSIPRGADRVAVLNGVVGEPTGLSAPPAPPERGPAPPNSSAAAPGTDAEAAFANRGRATTSYTLPDNDPQLAIQAQDAAVRAPDTASGDAAKQAVLASQATSTNPGAGDTARDTSANSPRSGALTPREESTQMPKAGQANNHSSPSLEQDSGR